MIQCRLEDKTKAVVIGSPRAYKQKLFTECRSMSRTQQDLSSSKYSGKDVISQMETEAIKVESTQFKLIMRGQMTSDRTVIRNAFWRNRVRTPAFQTELYRDQVSECNSTRHVLQN
ncbi:hypothetical protein CBL_14462 [Carabus blaptoides fortunei]